MSTMQEVRGRWHGLWNDCTLQFFDRKNRSKTQRRQLLTREHPGERVTLSEPSRPTSTNTRVPPRVRSARRASTKALTSKVEFCKNDRRFSTHCSLPGGTEHVSTPKNQRKSDIAYPGISNGAVKLKQGANGQLGSRSPADLLMLTIPSQKRRLREH